jgi:hypothetical protein
MDAWDMSDPFVIPTLINPDVISVEDCWAERKLTGMHLLKNWGKLTPDNSVHGSEILSIMPP